VSTNLIVVLLASLVTAAACAAFSDPTSQDRRAPLVAEAPDAGMIAIAAPGSRRVRVLYARNGGMVLLRELRLSPADSVRGIALSADGQDLVIDTPRTDYIISTRQWDRQPLRSVAVVPTVSVNAGTL
jgi:hypothetical protein